MPAKSAGLSKRAATVFVLGLGLGTGLAGCSTSADVTYGEYRFGPGYEGGHVYENHVYGDTQRGFGRESCRTVLRRGTGPDGRPASVEESVCD